MERRLGIMQSVEPVLENAIKTLQKVVDVRGMGRKWNWFELYYLRTYLSKSQQTFIIFGYNKKANIQ